ncbi:hypothetical protein MtrunA17_Chr1g0184371 [Medicago truncatula]|uniref:Uncharacterized protein n=1 Tax=Medicago truncatula TaxID=3880 RepID=A0A396JTI4_MEDTR|nr:hypothetical protein MtrunA17_Chr3g0117051 [Medicago truncatula]RHN80081.1 hypothetical protein MtrunA17_Chr1g0184371 [Medicago truncatula]
METKHKSAQNVKPLMKAFESKEIAKWKARYEDEKKKTMLISLIVFGWFVKN